MNNRYSFLLLTIFAVTNSALVASSHPDKKYNLRKAKRLTLTVSSAPGMYRDQEREVTFVKGKPSPDEYGKEGMPVLTYCVEKDDKKNARCLLNHGANPNIQGVCDNKTYNPRPPLFEAKSAGMVRLLVGKGADLGLRSHGNTALQLAICHDKPACVVAAFCQAGFDPRALSTRFYGPQMDAMDMAIDRARFMRDNDHMLKIGVLYWYGADIEKITRITKEASEGILGDTSAEALLYFCRVQTFLARLSDKRKNTPRPSAGIVAPHLDNIMPLGILVSDYCREVPPADIDSWQELIEE